MGLKQSSPLREGKDHELVGHKVRIARRDLGEHRREIETGTQGDRNGDADAASISCFTGGRSKRGRDRNGDAAASPFRSPDVNVNGKNLKKIEPESLKGDVATLVHELVHAYHGDPGGLGKYPGQMEPTIRVENTLFSVAGVQTPYFEMATVGGVFDIQLAILKKQNYLRDITENGIRKELGLPIRMFYRDS